MPLRNYVVFSEGVPETVHFAAHEYRQMTITDKVTRLPVTKNALQMTVDEIGGSKVDEHGLPIIAQLSVMSEQLAGAIEPYIAGRAYLSKNFTITQRGQGFLTKYTVLVSPRT